MKWRWARRRSRENKNLVALVQGEEVVTWTKLIAQRQVGERSVSDSVH